MFGNHKFRLENKIFHEKIIEFVYTIHTNFYNISLFKSYILIISIMRIILFDKYLQNFYSNPLSFC